MQQKYLPNYLLIISLICFSTFQFSCTKLVTVDPPKNQLVSSVVFSDSIDANAAVLGLYVKIMNLSTDLNLNNGGATIYTGLSSDELSSTTSDPNEQQFFTCSISPITNTRINSLWSYGYQLIYQCNACIEGLNQSLTLSSSVKNRLMGEAYVVRALTYYYLVNLFGSIPLVLTSDYHISSSLGQVSNDVVLDAIINDLNLAESLLPDAYLSVNKSRPNRFTAAALLSRVLLYKHQWADVVTAASTVLNSPQYGLETDLNKVFRIGNKESIWQLPPLQAGYQTAEGQFFVPSSAMVVPKYPLNHSLFQAFSGVDRRKSTWLTSNTVGGTVYTFPFKCKLVYANGASPQEYYNLIRLAEVYLIRAEARCQLQDFDGAKQDLNQVRRRAGLSDNTDTNADQLLQAIYEERRLELFCELGHRWFDLKRTGKINTVLSLEKGADWTATDSLYPIPFSELQLNPKLKQNPGY